MHVHFALLIFRFEATTDFKPSTLCSRFQLQATNPQQERRTIVCTIRARHQFLVSPLERKPCLQITLFRRGEIQRATDDGDDAIRQSETLIKRLAVGEHRVERVPALLWRSDDKLLHLFKLVDAKDAPHVAAG